MVLGSSIAVTCVPLVSQCAEITNTAFGLVTSRPIFAQVRENSLSSMPFIGEPWPMNKTGSFSSCSFRSSVQFLKLCNDIESLLFFYEIDAVFLNVNKFLLIQGANSLFKRFLAHFKHSLDIFR